MRSDRHCPRGIGHRSISPATIFAAMPHEWPALPCRLPMHKRGAGQASRAVFHNARPADLPMRTGEPVHAAVVPRATPTYAAAKRAEMNTRAFLGQAERAKTGVTPAPPAHRRRCGMPPPSRPRIRLPV
ncbi:hypothetical protein [Burkholderia thailandensis]|uniref:hypothetical protein n=1 Tax=Burkholderia thailandensis TaxID=57975 RepID=UPI0005F1CE4B|nr:hypothetical protein [Burkholderia thailandensis]AOJ59600.1 hypothetical protein AQ477_24040 [Burkholderia thailandensis]KXF58721.1 hypothetical protein AQ476_29175 [Burkholderia thailandensis]PNE78693.1 hypothetical protein A8H37_11305 [Burkholderia thailandensis]